MTRHDSLDRLKAWMPKGTTVYTVLRHVSASGMRREIGLVLLNDGQLRHPNHAASQVLGLRLGKRDGLITNGGGMDMGYDLVHRLGEELHGDGYALRHEWI